VSANKYKLYYTVFAIVGIIVFQNFILVKHEFIAAIIGIIFGIIFLDLLIYIIKIFKKLTDRN
jgi:dolichol kinase